MQAGTHVGISSIQTGASEACCTALRAVPSRLLFGGTRDSAERALKRVTAWRLAMVRMLALLGFAKLGLAKPAKASHTGVTTMQIIARHAGPAADDRAPIRSVPRDARQRLVCARLLKPQGLPMHPPQTAGVEASGRTSQPVSPARIGSPALLTLLLEWTSAHQTGIR